MKYEITKGSEKDFDGIGNEDVVRVYYTGQTKFYAVAEEMSSIPSDWLIIAERRPITEPVWDGEGLPPVGVECEVKTSARHPYEWEKCKIVFSDENSGVAFVYAIKGSLDCVGASRPDFFRPIRSPEDVARDEAGLAIYHAINWNSEGELVSPSRMEDYKKAYDAIAAGKIPGVTLSGK